MVTYMSKEKKDNPECQTKAVCNANLNALVKVCEEKHRRVDEKLDCYERDIRGINKKMNATLVTVVIMLASLIVSLIQYQVTH